MATVQLSDAVIPEVFLTYSTLDNPELTAFWNSGIVATNDTLNTIARVGGKTCIVPFWQDLDPTIEPNASNDDPADLASPQKLGSGQMTARKAWLNQGWSTMDLVQELAGSDPMQRIAARTNVYWQRQWQRRLIAMLLGVFNANVANNGGDMVIDGSAAVLDGDMVIDASGTLGDLSGRLTGIAVHSQVRDRMLKNDQIIWTEDSTGKLVMMTYKGLYVVVDDSMPILSGSGSTAVYLSVLFGPNAVGFGGIDGEAFAYGEGLPRVPVEVWRQPQAGNGGGLEQLWMRKTWLLHPAGYDWIESPAGNLLTEQSPMIADLKNGAHWNRLVSRKQVPLAFIKSLA